jgi:hypothetical protein
MGFAGLNAIGDVLAISDHSTSAFIQCILRIDQLTVILQEPDHTIVGTSFLVGGERHDDVAIRLEAFPLESRPTARPR